MELRDYFLIARRWWWLILLPAVVAGLYGAATYHRPAPSYSASVRYTASQPATLVSSPGYDPNYYRWLTSEYIVTALKTWVQSGDFAAAVGAELAAKGKPAPAVALSSDNVRSILVISFSSGDSSQVGPVFDAITTVLQRDNAAVFPQLGGLAAVVQPLDPPSVVAVAPSLRVRLDLPLKLALGLVVGVGLALLAHYFDQTRLCATGATSTRWGCRWRAKSRGAGAKHQRCGAKHQRCGAKHQRALKSAQAGMVE